MSRSSKAKLVHAHTVNLKLAKSMRQRSVDHGDMRYELDRKKPKLWISYIPQ